MLNKCNVNTSTLPEKYRSTVLVVVDVQVEREMLRDFLEREGHKVAEVGDGVRALDMIQHLDPGLVLLDMTIPVMGGFTFCSKMQQLFKNNCPPVLMLISSDNDRYVDQALAAGATDFITRPINRTVLRNRVRLLLHYKQTGVLQEKSETLAQSIINHAHDGIITLCPDGLVRSLNNAARDLFGYTSCEAVGSSVKKLMPELDQVLNQPVTYNKRLELLGVRKDGLMIPVELMLSSFTVDNQKLITGILRDITRRKQAEDELKYAKAVLEGTINAIPDIIGIQEPDYRIVRYNDAGYKFLNMTPEEVFGKRCFELFHRSSPCQVCATEKAIKSGKLEHIQKYLPEMDIYLDCRSNPVFSESGELLMVVEQLRDITEQKKLEARIQAERDYYWSIFDSMPHYVLVSKGFTIEFINRSAREQLGELTGLICYQGLGLSEPCPECPEEKFMANDHPGPIQYTVEVFGRVLEGSATRLVNPDGSTSSIKVLNDVTERKEMEARLKYLSLHDPLTGLYNRNYFEQEMRRLRQMRHTPIGIIVCDVDGLKLINDTLGHESGDTLLKVAAKTISKSFREGDMIARIGGDEFALLLPNCSREKIENAVHRIRNAVDAYNAANPELLLSISVGFAVSTNMQVNMDELFKEADNNMYREKLHSSKSARSAIVQTLMRTLKARDFITEGHADRLQELVVALANNIGLPERNIADLRLLAQFHDIGKVGIPDRILFKPGLLSDDEVNEIRQHCEIGHRIAQSAPDLGTVADWILKHHEWWSGEGYPLGLKGDEIPLECRILAIADAYDAMISDRPYRKAMSPRKAMAELKKCAGVQFDPDMTERFIKIIVTTQESEVRSQNKKNI